MLSRQYVKLCDLSDFDDPELRSCLRAIVPGHPPQRELHRKYWEYAMLVLYLRDVGALREGAEVLSVGAGHEEVLFWLANHVARVLATDIYGEGGFARGEADASMLTDPSAFAPYEFRRDHLDVMSTNALDLSLPDESFDVVFSLSSIEHFGGPRAVARAAAEMSRVLRPGGQLVIVTECFVSRHALDSPLVQYALRIASGGRRCASATPRRRVIDVLTPREIERQIVKPTGLELVQPLDTEISAQTRASTIPWAGSGPLARHEPSPHILLKAHGAPWTSVFLAFQKPRRPERDPAAVPRHAPPSSSTSKCS